MYSCIDKFNYALSVLVQLDGPLVLPLMQIDEPASVKQNAILFRR